MYIQILNPYWPLVAVYEEPGKPETDALEVLALALSADGQPVALVWDGEQKKMVDAASLPHLVAVERDAEAEDGEPAGTPAGAGNGARPKLFDASKLPGAKQP